jgi:hypothetical protein
MTLPTDAARAEGYVDHVSRFDERETVETIVRMIGAMTVIHDESASDRPSYYEAVAFWPVNPSRALRSASSGEFGEIPGEAFFPSNKKQLRQMTVEQFSAQYLTPRPEARVARGAIKVDERPGDRSSTGDPSFGLKFPLEPGEERLIVAERLWAVAQYKEFRGGRACRQDSNPLIRLWRQNRVPGSGARPVRRTAAALKRRPDDWRAVSPPERFLCTQCVPGPS